MWSLLWNTPFCTDGKYPGYPTTDKTNLVWEKTGKGLKESVKDTVAYFRTFIIETLHKWANKIHGKVQIRDLFRHGVSLTHLFNAGEILYCWKYCNLFTNVMFKSLFGYISWRVHNESVRVAWVDRRQCVGPISCRMHPVMSPHSYRKMRPIWASSETSSFQYLNCAKHP